MSSSNYSVADVEGQVGTILPKDYANFLTDYPGGEIEPRGFFMPGETRTPDRIIDYPLPKSEVHRELEINVLIPHQIGLLFTLNAKCRLLDAYPVIRRVQPWLPKEVIPIGFDGDARAIVLGVAGDVFGRVFMAMPALLYPLYDRYEWDLDFDAQAQTTAPLGRVESDLSRDLLTEAAGSFSLFLSGLTSHKPIIRAGHVLSKQGKALLSRSLVKKAKLLLLANTFSAKAKE